MVAFAEQGLGGPQILVNNAGGGGHIEPHFPDAEPEQWQSTLGLGGGGVVVNVASTAGLGFGPYVSPEYAAAKAGLIRFTSSLSACESA
jgi:NAD(P)-dependent dehydrogenase (short-subunit alcohol dehydrogenase family)